MILAALAASALPLGIQREARFETLRKYPAPEATQGVAVDRKHFYAVGNRVIGKYDRATGKLVSRWEGPANGPTIHMNSAIVRQGRVIAAHSNFPGVPMVSSVEFFSAETLRPERTVPLGIYEGSLVWALPYEGGWLACFGHYNDRGGEPGKTNDRSAVVRFDRDWRRLGAYSFPATVVARWDGMTASGGILGKDGLLYSTGHHAPEVHVLRIPKMGATLEHVETIPSPCEGQAIDYDPDTDTFWQIQRKERAVYQLRLVRG